MTEDTAYCAHCGNLIRKNPKGDWLDNGGSPWCPSGATSHKPAKI